jgi:hypothetical protein
VYVQVPETNAVTTLPVDLEVTVQVDDLRSDWKRVGYLANYFAEYVAYDFPQRERAENLLSTITNEILEAVVHLAPLQTTLLLRCKHVDNHLVLDLEHRVRAELSPSYALFVEKMRESNDEQLYLHMLTSEVKPEEYFNQLGLMILGYDFNVHLSTIVVQETHQFSTHVDVPDMVLSK